jgi:thioredoxin reductase
VLLCDGGHQRNLRSHAIHGLLGQEGRPPASFLEEARQAPIRYGSVSVRDTEVIDIRPAGERFTFACADGATGIASKVLLATGLADEIPELPGIEPLYGVSVHHCLYCDGFEYSGKTVAAHSKGDKGADLAIMMKHWIADVTACSDGTEVSLHALRRLEEHNIPLRSEPLRFLEGTDDCHRPARRRAVSRESTSLATCRVTCVLSRSRSAKARRQLSRSTRRFCVATGFANSRCKLAQRSSGQLERNPTDTWRVGTFQSLTRGAHIG